MMLVGNNDQRFDSNRLLAALRAGRARMVIAQTPLGRGVPLPATLARFVRTRGFGRSKRRTAAPGASKGSSGDPHLADGSIGCR